MWTYRAESSMEKAQVLNSRGLGGKHLEGREGERPRSTLPSSHTKRVHYLLGMNESGQPHPGGSPHTTVPVYACGSCLAGQETESSIHMRGLWVVSLIGQSFIM